MAVPHARETGTPAVLERGTWSAPEHPFAVHFPPDLLRKLAAEAVEGLAAIPRGGIEVGGVLYGHHAGGDEVTIIESRQLECEYKFGPSFALSEVDEQRLEELVRAPAGDPALAGLETVGWFHSHTRSGIYLSEDDCRIFDRFFPQPWQVALVLRPEPLKPTRAGFFFREPGEEMRTASSYLEFEVAGRRRGEVAALPAPEVVEAKPDPGLKSDLELDREAAEPEAITEVPVPPPALAVPERRPWGAIWLLSVVGVIAALASWLWLGPRTPAVPDVGLRMTAGKGVVFLEWNPHSPTVAHSVAGQLEIEDGENPRLEISLEPADLRAGRVSFVPHSSQLHARLRLFDAAQSPQDFVATFVAPGFETKETTPAVNPPEAVNPPQNEATAVEAAHSEPPPVTPTPKSELPASTTVEVTPAQKAFKAPVAEKKAASAPVLTTPPQIASTPSIPASPLPSPATPLAAPVPAPAPPPPARQEKPVVRAPASGRAIWTGELKAGETLTFENGRASKGSISGGWPQGPAQLRASVGELGEGSLAIYSSDPATRDRAGAFESPSARNGWNLTTYRWDPKIARQLRALEGPSAGNGWKRLVVKADRKLTLIVIDWAELPAGAK